MKSKTLYWISERQDLDTHEISPAVPQNFLTRGGVIDNKTKRILLYSSLPDAISVFSLGRKNMSGMTLSVYRPRFIPEKNKLTPSLSDSPYSLVLDGEEYWCLVELEMIKVADIKIGEKIGEKKFNYGSRILKHSFTRSETLGVYSWAEILPEWDKKGKTMKLERKNFGKTADKATKDKPAAREAGLIGGSALIGLGAGLGVHGAANKLNSGRKKAIKFIEKKINEDAEKRIKNIVPDDPITAATAKSSIEGEKLAKLEKTRAISTKLKKVTKPVSKFAKTKGGKAALIGVPTAIVGGVVYKAAKKKDKKDKEGGK